MGTQSQNDEPSARVNLLSQRIRVLLDRVWEGNQARMAKDLGINPASLSRFLSGKYLPGYTMFAALAKRPEINIRWLLTGEGDPLIEGSNGEAIGRSLPIAEELLPGPPDEHPELLSGASYPVADAFFSRGSYWLRAPRGLVLAGKRNVTGRDLLLIETGPRWTGRWSALMGMYCGVRFKLGRRTRMVLVKIGFMTESDLFRDEFQVYGVEVFSTDPSTFPINKNWKFVVPGAGGEMPDYHKEDDVHCFTVKEIAGICLRLERSLIAPAEEKHMRMDSTRS